MKVATLKRRAEFLKVRGGPRWSGGAFLVEGRARDVRREPHPTARAKVGDDAAKRDAAGRCDVDTGARYGLVITKKIGGAVLRNRIRRRIKSALQALPPSATAPAIDYVIVARPTAATVEHAALKRDLAAALAHVQRRLARCPEVANVDPAPPEGGPASRVHRRAPPDRREPTPPD